MTVTPAYAATTLLTAAVGTLVFAMFFVTRTDNLVWATLGGVLAWASYLALSFLQVNPYLAYVVASLLLTVWAEVMGRLRQCPTTVFIVVAAIPLFPGRLLFKTMLHAARFEWRDFASTGLETLVLACCIAAGVLITTTVFKACARANELRKAGKKRP